MTTNNEAFDINQPFVTQEQKFKYWEESKAEIKKLQASNHDLREAGQALIDRWDSPKWVDNEHTGVFIDALRKALKATPAESLQAFENEVIEKCAKHLYDEGYFQGSNAIRALKEVK